DQLVYVAELGISRHHGWRACVIAVVEDTADANVVIGLLLDRADERFGVLASADDYGPPLNAAVACPAADEPCGGKPQGEHQQQARGVPGAQPEARELG